MKRSPKFYSAIEQEKLVSWGKCDFQTVLQGFRKPSFLELRLYYPMISSDCDQGGQFFGQGERSASASSFTVIWFIYKLLYYRILYVPGSKLPLATLARDLHDW